MEIASSCRKSEEDDDCDNALGCITCVCVKEACI